MDRSKIPASRQSVCLSLGPVTAPLCMTRCHYDNRLRQVNFFSKSVLKSRLCANCSQFPWIRNTLLSRALSLFLACENSSVLQAGGAPEAEPTPMDILHPSRPVMQNPKPLLRPTSLAAKQDSRSDRPLPVGHATSSPCSGTTLLNVSNG